MTTAQRFRFLAESYPSGNTHHKTMEAGMKLISQLGRVHVSQLRQMVDNLVESNIIKGNYDAADWLLNYYDLYETAFLLETGFYCGDN